jgi:hypothetical protein
MKVIKTKSIRQLIKEADKWFSLYIRLRDSNKDGCAKCTTCDYRGYFKEMDNGHFLSRSYLSTRYNPKNCGIQCKGCNAFKGGQQFLFAKVIDKKYGDGTADLLVLESRQICKRTKADYQNLIFHYKEKAKQLATEKGIKL